LFNALAGYGKVTRPDGELSIIDEGLQSSFSFTLRN